MKYDSKTGQLKFDTQAKSNNRQTVQFADEDCMYILANDKQYGPMQFGDLKRLSQEGVILLEDIQVKTSGSEKWLSAEDIPSLLPVSVTAKANDRTVEKIALRFDRPRASARLIWDPDKQAAVPQFRDGRRCEKDYLTRSWQAISSFSTRYWPPRLLATIATIIAAVAVIYWIDTRTSIRSELALLASFLIWAMAVAACLWIWTDPWQTAVDLKPLVSNGLSQPLSRLSLETAPKIAVAIAVIVTCIGFFQIAALLNLIGDNTSPAQQSADTLQRLSDHRALATAALIEKVANTDDRIEKILMRNEVYRSVRASAPRVYAQIFQKFKSGVHIGKSTAELNAEVLPIINSIFTAALPYASDDNLLRFTRFFVKEAKILKREKPSDCYFILNPRKANRRLILAIRNRHPELRNQEAQIQAQILRDFSSDKNKVLPNKINVSMLLKSINDRLRRRKDVDTNMLLKENITPNQHGLYCTSLVAVYEETLRLPKIEAISLLRYLFAPK